ncbi:MAG TPA: hypothetical protein VMX16_05820 [Terriglobia bacterium]|nr:hypothetical protein [Terriglobia bacterium]
MNQNGPDDYSEDEWRAAAGHFPLADRPIEDFLLLHRHWMWANQQREAFDRELSAASAELFEPGPAALASPGFGFMFVWYGMLWAVIEGLTDPCERRCVDIRGRFRADIDSVSSLLHRCRNAILHVPRTGDLLDDRIVALVSEPASASTIRRTSRGLGRMFLEEYRRRNPQARGAG